MQGGRLSRRSSAVTVVAHCAWMAHDGGGGRASWQRTLSCRFTRDLLAVWAPGTAALVTLPSAVRERMLRGAFGVFAASWVLYLKACIYSRSGCNNVGGTVTRVGIRRRRGGGGGGRLLEVYLWNGRVLFVWCGVATCWGGKWGTGSAQGMRTGVAACGLSEEERMGNRSKGKVGSGWGNGSSK